VEQEAFGVDLASVLVSADSVTLVEVHLCFGITSVAGDTLLCHFGKEGRHWSDVAGA